MPLDLVAETTLRARDSARARSVFGDPSDSDPGEHRFLDCQFLRAAPVHPAADLGVLAFHVFPDNDQVKVVR